MQHVSSDAPPPGCSHLEVADAPQLGAVVSADAPVATGGVIANPQVALPLRHIYKKHTEQTNVCECACVALVSCGWCCRRVS